MTISANEVETQGFTSESADLEITRPKRTKIEHQKVEEKPCIICNKVKMKGDVKRHRICEIKRAKQLISVIRFLKDKFYDRRKFYWKLVTYQKFKDERMEKRVIKLFDPIEKVKMKSCSSLTQSCQKLSDMKKETVQLMRNIYIARIRDYDLKELLQHEITSALFYLTKNGYLRKSPKSELVQVLKTYHPEVLSEVSGAEVPFCSNN